MKISRSLPILILIFLLAGCMPPALTETIPPAALDQTAVQTKPAIPPTPTPTSTLPSPEPTATVTPSPTPLPTPTFTPEPSGPPGIILFIGDGMGAVHRQAATWLVSGEGGLLMMDNMPVQGLATTVSADKPITDSAAGTTAMATGTLTNNGYLGVDPAGSALTTILELAQVSGWSVGLVTTTQLSHATPAAFAVHYPDRDNMPEIARQMMTRQVDVLLGGGEDDFFSTDESGCYPGNGRQKPGSSLVSQALEDGYTHLCTAEDLRTVDLAETDRLIGLFSGGGMIPPFSPSLVEMTQAAISILSQDPDGFFLMVEAGQVDWASHENDAFQTMENTVGLESAVVMAQIYALNNPNTLIIVAADHETGGMRVNREGIGSYLLEGPFSMPDGSSFWVDWSTTGHTADPIPVTAQGPYAEMLEGEYPLTRIFEAMSAMLFNAGQ